MFKILGWIAGIAAILLVAAVAVGWLVLQSSAFSAFRRDLVQTVLTEQIGQPVVINDDVRMQARRNSTVHAGGVVIPSENIDGFNLAELDRLSFKLDLFKALRGKVDLDELVISGLHVDLVREEDGTTSWTRENVWTSGAQAEEAGDEESAATADEATGEDDLGAAAGAPQMGIFKFLNGKTVQVEDIRLTIDNRWTGFEFAFLLDRLSLEQRDGGAVQRLAGEGMLNGRQFEISGTFPHGQPFEADVRLGKASLTVDGTPFPEDRGEGYDARIAFDPESLGDLLETLGLKRSFEGTGSLTAELTATPAAIRVANLDAGLTFLNGQSLSITGKIDDIRKRAGIDIEVVADLRPDDAPLAPATKLSEIRLVDLDGRIVGAGKGVRLDDLKIRTNAFEQDLRQIGPVSVGRIHRTPEDELSLSGIDVQIGPEGAPVIHAEGDIRDVFAFKGVEFQGSIDAPASLVIKRLEPEDVAEFGSLKGEFAVSDATGQLAVTGFKGYAYGSDLWSLDAELSVADMARLANLDFRFDLGISDGARFLEALKLKSIDTGQIRFQGRIEGDGADLSAGIGTVTGESRIDATLASKLTEDDIVLRGGLKSAEIHIADLRDAVGTAVQIRSLFAGKSEKEIQPLVIEAKREPEKQADKIQPLVIERKPEKIVSKQKLLERLDLEFGIAIDRILGQEGVSGVNGEVTVKEGVLEAGPVEASYGGGHFKVAAVANLLDDSDVIGLRGTTGGWDIGEILESVGLGIDAYGKLNGSFDVSGRSASMRSFLASMSGNATIRMRDGRIATSLIELAGLGIFEWLFSEERRQGYTDIVCVHAPIRLNAGSVSSDSIVAETGSVQIVADGRLDMGDKSIALHVEPRPVGKPFARSAFPVEISGTLDDPKFRILFAGLPGDRSGPHPPFLARPLETHTPCVLDK